MSKDHAKGGSEIRAMMTLGDEQIVVRLDDQGILQGAKRVVRLFYGTDLYAACQGTPRADQKVAPYQPGYMKLVQAAGGTLTCPPVVVDAEGRRHDNPRVTYSGATRIVESVEAVALCVVPNPLTGRPVVSIGRIVVDCLTVLRQSLMRIEDPNIVRILAPDDAAAQKEEGQLKGWVCVPFIPGIADIWANTAKGAVREAMSTYTQQGATARQRAQSKAERLACDHNAVLRRTWRYGDLQAARRPDGSVNENAPRFIDVPMVSFRELPGGELEQLQSRLHNMARAGEASVSAAIVDASWTDDQEPEDEEVDEPRALPGPTLEVPDAPPLREAVPAPAPAPAAVRAAAAPKSAGLSSPATPRQIKDLADLEGLYESERGSGAAAALRAELGLGVELTAPQAKRLIDHHQAMAQE